MKIIIATDFWQPSINGVTRNVQNIKAVLEKSGFDVLVIGPKLFDNIPLFFYKDVRIALFPYRKIAAIFKKETPDYVIVATEGTVGLAVRKYCLRNGLRFVSMYQGNIPDYVKYYTGIKSNAIINVVYAYFKWFHGKSGAIVVATQSLQEELAKRKFKNLAYCPLAVDTNFFIKNSQAPNVYRHPVFVYFGRVAKEKNVEEFLQCQLPGVKIVIGDGPLKKHLEKKYPQAVFTGFKEGRELVDLLSVADVFVFPSTTETFGLVIVEALACGLPVAARQVMGPKDIITNGFDGYLDNNLQKAALACLTIKRENCRQTALKFSLEAFQENMTSIILKHPA